MSSIFWIWMAAAVIFLILELMTPTLIFASFVAATAAAGVYSYFSPDSYYIQLGIFVGVAVILLPTTRVIAKKITKEPPQKSNVDALVGQTALVIKAIDPNDGGQIRFEGEVWRATAEVGIPAEQRVRIVSVSGTKVKVEPV